MNTAIGSGGKKSLSGHTKLTTITVFSLFLLLVLGCLGGSSHKCVGSVTVDGKTYTGSDQTPEVAKRNSCAGYCIEGDPEFDAMYTIWLDSLSERERKRVREGVKGKWDALYASERIKSYVEACEQRCLREREVTAKCE